MLGFWSIGRSGKPVMIKSYLLACILAVSAVTSGLAAEQFRRVVPNGSAEADNRFDWTGVYAGIHLGVGLGNSLILDRSAGVTTSPASAVLNALSEERFRTRQAGVVGGGQVGYTYQLTPGSGLAVGFELDAQAANLRSRYAKTMTWPEIGGVESDKTYTANASALGQIGLDFFGSVRGRIGYGHDRILVYGTAGLAYAAPSFSGASTFHGSTTRGLISSETTVHLKGFEKFQSGYVYGAGFEYALPADSLLNFFGANAVTVKAEYLHYDFGNRATIDAAAGRRDSQLKQDRAVSKSKIEEDVFRAGINYRFGVY